eukprot:8858376-Pyramimonas_sp.AAC.1
MCIFAYAVKRAAAVHIVTVTPKFLRLASLVRSRKGVRTSDGCMLSVAATSLRRCPHMCHNKY